VKYVMCLCVAAMLFSTACGKPGAVTGTDHQTAAGTQSETTATTAYIAGTNRLVVSYNDETDEQQLISYTQAGRTVNKGASLMG
jgi:hypothetical protein